MAPATLPLGTRSRSTILVTAGFRASGHSAPSPTLTERRVAARLWLEGQPGVRCATYHASRDRWHVSGYLPGTFKLATWCAGSTLDVELAMGA
jgi:hypothetical protein